MSAASLWTYLAEELFLDSRLSRSAERSKRIFTGRVVTGSFSRNGQLTLLFHRLVHFRCGLAVGVVFAEGAGIVVVALEVGDEEIGVLCFLIRLRAQRRPDGSDAGVGDGAGVRPAVW